MNTTLRTSLVALLALIPILVTTRCNTIERPASPARPAPPRRHWSASAARRPLRRIRRRIPCPTPTRRHCRRRNRRPRRRRPRPVREEPFAGPVFPRLRNRCLPGPDVLPTDLSGEVYGFIRAVDVDQSQLTLDKVDWFSGAAAEQACAEDAVPQDAHLDGWCSAYYYRNVNPKLRDVLVSPDAVITTLQGTTPVSDDLQTLADQAKTSRATTTSIAPR